MVYTKYEVAIKLFIAPGNTAKLFNFIAETLHQVAVLVPVMIRLWLLVAIAAHGYDHHGSHVLDHLDEIIGIICLVGNHHLRIQTLHQGGSLDRNLDRRSNGTSWIA